MKRKFKQILAALIVAIMLVGIAPMSEINYVPKASAKDISSYSVGDTITYGSYPQTKVTDRGLIAKIEAAGADNSWVDYNYYAGTGKSDDGEMKSVEGMMLYKDISYGGNKYRAVKINLYRPIYTGLVSSADNTHQIDNDYYTENTYYFKYEPLTWRVLDPSEGYVMCDRIIDSQAYQNYKFDYDCECYNSRECTNYASDWLTSSLRKWLNNDFYYTAFNAEEQSEIGVSRLENQRKPSCKYDSENSFDKIFPISYYDAINSTYGFDSSYFSSETRKMLGTDYAKCQGLNDDDWWLRLPNYSYSAAWTDGGGRAYSYYNDYGALTETTCVGVVPAFKFNANKKSVFSISVIDETDSEVKLSLNLERGGFCAFDVKIDSYNDFSTISRIEKSDKLKSFLSSHENDNIGPLCATSVTTGTASLVSLSEYNLKGSIFVFTFRKRTNEFYARKSDFYVKIEDCVDLSNNNLSVELINNIPELENYTIIFEGNGGNSPIVSSTISSRDSIILPTPEKKYTITYNANNGVGAPPEQNINIACKGWSTNNSATSAMYFCGNRFRPIADTTLYAVWNNLANTTISSAKPTRAGYEFQGWSTDKNATIATYFIGTSITLSDDITLYAVWSKSDLTNPTGSISSTNHVASSQTVTISLLDNVGISGYYWGTSSIYDDNTYIATNLSSVTETVSSPGTYYLTVKDTSGNVSSNYSITFYKTALNATGGDVVPAYVLTKSGDSFTFPTPTKSGYMYLGWSLSTSDTSGLTSLKPSSNDTYYAIWKLVLEDNIYNLGDETYSFENYGDDDSPYGHCFGMAVTSSGYYLGDLDKKIIGGNDKDSLYSFSDTSIVRKPICHYLQIQGPGAEYESIVAGGSKELNGRQNIKKDWNECINYVKDHRYDNKGSLNVGMWFAGGGGHAVNFLYYKEVDGQQRIYIYDNNFPEIETYYYMGSDGYVHQAPMQTAYSGIVGIDLMDVKEYFTLAEKFDVKRYIYADKNEILIEGAKMYDMKCGVEKGSYVMYEIPDNSVNVSIKPLTDNVSFSYDGETYSFGSVDNKTYGVLTIPSKNSSPEEKADFKIMSISQNVKSVSISDISLNYKQSTTLKPTIKADNGTKYKVEYSTSNAKVATVDQNGKVTATKRGSGTATITCTVTDSNGNVVKDTCKVSVSLTWWQWIIIIVLFGWIWY